MAAIPALRPGSMIPLLSRRNDALPEGLALRAPCGHSLPCGCADVAECCELCPLERCRYEEPGGIRAIRNAERDPQIIALRAEGMPVDDIAERFRLSRRSVYRVVAGEQ